MSLKLSLTAAAALAAGALSIPASAQMHHFHRTGPHTVVDRQHGHTTVYHSGRHGFNGRTYNAHYGHYGRYHRGYYGGYHRGWRTHCWTTWHHHHPVRHCR